MQNEYEAEEKIHLSLLTHIESDKRQAINRLHFSKAMDPIAAKAVVGYWSRVGSMVGSLEQLDTVDRFCKDLDRDLERIKSLQSHLSLQGRASQRESELLETERILRTLGNLRTKLRKRRSHLYDEALMRYLFWNPATPNTMPKALRDHQKNEQKRSKRDRARAATEKREGPAAPKPKAPTKQMKQPERERKEG